MDARRRLLCAGLLGLLIACPGCLSDEVVYVDEQGRELSVDEQGQPILPGRAGSGAETAPPAPAMGDWPASPPTDLPPAASRGPEGPTPGRVSLRPATPAKPAGPTPDPTWDAPGGARPSAPPTTPGDVPPAKPVDSSSGLDRPPAG